MFLKHTLSVGHQTEQTQGEKKKNKEKVYCVCSQLTREMKHTHMKNWRMITKQSRKNYMVWST